MWFVYRNGQPLGPADKLQGPLANVTDFRRALKGSRSSSADLDGVKASLLKVYRDRETYEKRISLAANDSIEGLGKEMETALIVEKKKVLLIRRVIQKKLSNVVVLFDGQGSTSGHSKTVVAYIQVTTQKEKKFKPDRLKRLNEEIDKHPQLKDLKRAFVVVGPDSNVCKTFHLRDAPDQGAFLTVVSCFDPDLL
ncbi:hypothetical protein PR002_g16144 [Phytophthora rubi]|uniref:Uncharacterized protein n=1 Tax=Phytophthora rubi TaxID=129364 RepID=A0A6A3KUX3_9STRA|nr:hypothetical protein PR002_g16144 [Phytophthora rubi]